MWKIAVFAWLAAVGAALAECRDNLTELRGDWGNARFTVEVADTPVARAQGLMHRESMASGAGMIFFFERPQRAVFWMKNTLIPLDMIFIGADGVVRHVHENAIPHDETGIDGGTGVLAVLEINGGLAGALGIDVGTEVRHPGFNQSRLTWPCPES